MRSQVRAFGNLRSIVRHHLVKNRDRLRIRPQKEPAETDASVAVPKGPQIILGEEVRIVERVLDPHRVGFEDEERDSALEQEVHHLQPVQCYLPVPVRPVGESFIVELSLRRNAVCGDVEIVWLKLLTCVVPGRDQQRLLVDAFHGLGVAEPGLPERQEPGVPSRKEKNFPVGRLRLHPGRIPYSEGMCSQLRIVCLLLRNLGSMTFLGAIRRNRLVVHLLHLIMFLGSRGRGRGRGRERYGGVLRGRYAGGGRGCCGRAVARMRGVEVDRGTVALPGAVRSNRRFVDQLQLREALACKGAEAEGRLGGARHGNCDDAYHPQQQRHAHRHLDPHPE
mmetsp:Transcript_41957/g.98874  ORF Transcript_41957/g.98874 Transcript_41957/m.98874 type:complete len:336 (-) Transcript_41957:97-1104(-)